MNSAYSAYQTTSVWFCLLLYPLPWQPGLARPQLHIATLAGPDLRLESKEDDEHKDDEEHKEHTVGELGESEPSPVRNPLTAAPVESKVTEPVLPPDTLAAATAAKELPAVPADHLPEANQHVTPVAPGELKPTQTEAMDASNRHGGWDQSFFQFQAAEEVQNLLISIGNKQLFNASTMC